MTAAAVLNEARSLGVQLSVTPEGGIRWGSPAPLPEALRRDIVAYRADVLDLLRGAPLNAGVPWDPAAADALLAELRTEVARIRADFGNRLPAPLENVLADALAIAEGYIANHDAEARRGWDAMVLLRKMVPYVRRCVMNSKQVHP